VSTYFERIISLAESLQKNSLNEEALNLVAQVVEVTEVTPLGIIPPDHPLYDRIRGLLHNQSGGLLQQKLDSFHQRTNF